MSHPPRGRRTGVSPGCWTVAACSAACSHSPSPGAARFTPSSSSKLPLLRPASAPYSPQMTYAEAVRSGGRAAVEGTERFLMRSGPVHETLRRITDRLTELGIPYSVAGGMALVAHGYNRTTVHVDILVTADGLDRIHQSPASALDRIEARFGDDGWSRPAEGFCGRPGADSFVESRRRVRRSVEPVRAGQVHRAQARL